MTLTIVFIFTHIAAFILGALVFRNNSSAINAEVLDLKTKLKAAQDALKSKK